jgi:glycosyltransferase involved in cell wall biosynthesis
MRVVMVILEYAPITGGAQRQIAALAPTMIAAGAEIHVITRRRTGLAAEETIDGVRVHRLAAPGPKALASLVFTAGALFRLFRLRPDRLHVYSLFSPATIGLLARRLLGVPVVAKVLRGGEGGDVERLRAKPLAGWRIAALREGIDRYIAISSEIDSELEGLGIDRARRVSIPNGVDVRRFRPAVADERRALRTRLELPDGPVAVYVGRLVAEKRVERLIEAFGRLRERHPDATLAIVGGGVCETALRRIAGPGVRFVGEVDDVAPWLRAADLFVLPSGAEGLSNALLEAMATGLPVVATRVGGALDVVDDGHSGRLVAVDDPTELRDALCELLDPAASGLRADLGRRARAAVIEQHALESVAARLTDLYREVGPAAMRRVDIVAVPKPGAGEGARR